MAQAFNIAYEKWQSQKKKKMEMKKTVENHHKAADGRNPTESISLGKDVY